MAALPDGSPSEEASKLEQRRKSRSLTEEVTRSTTQQSHRRKSVTMTGSGGDEVVSRRRSSLIEDIGLPQGRRKSLAQRNRLSWTSDTGVTSSAVAEHLASEMMSLFDMEFSIDIQLSTAPKLPELTFSKRRSQRVSVDSLAALIPRFENYDMSGDAFESIVQNPKARPRKMTFPPPPAAPPPNPVNRSRSVSVPGDPDHIVSPPTRSSSLKQRRKFDPAAKYTDRNESCPPPLPKDKHINDNVPALKKKTSLRRLASFVSNASRKAMSRPAVPPINLQDKPLPEYPPKLDLQTLSPDAAANPSFEPPKPQRSLEELMTKAPSRQSLTSSVSSAWSSVSEFKVATKATNPYEQQPLVVLDIPPMVSNVSIGASENPKRRSYMLIRPTVIDAQDLRRSRSTGHRPSRRKRRSLMETTQSRRKSRQRKSMQEHLQQLELATAPPTIEPPRRKDSLRRHAVQAQAQNGDTTTSTPSQPSSAALSRSKSAFIRIGSLRSKHRKKKTEEPDLRRAVTLSKSETNVQKGNVNYAVHHSGYSESSLSSSDSNHTHERFHSSQSNFVRRLTTFGRRKKHDPASPHPM
ncbi:uncharacterized protein BYT42DRAFT_78380 [Radiomyces spectabilis]|uniref:uncharacterized protein n=1 Tax=Radiomyces spectabilis TaxID=64574 RepID=UPI00221F8A64|nr:uncharacterized protein BYT42DRAFT_78380 [Radiomyces spectabilis]KAI8371707.1 hypothetical protein BYT42DRAFT_78380 [Radiomyces spectabilis]